MEFICGLWIGTEKQKQNDTFLAEKNINIIINCENDLSYLDEKQEYNEVILENIKKYRDIRFSEYLYKITEFIHNSLIKLDNILIYQYKNNNLSVLILLAYLLRYGNLNLYKSTEMIRTKFVNSFNEKLIYKNAFSRFLKKI